jgi:hypothetical protein
LNLYEVIDQRRWKDDAITRLRYREKSITTIVNVAVVS